MDKQETLATLGPQDTERRQTKLPLWFVFIQCRVVLMLPVSPDCPLLIAPLVCLRSMSCGPNVASVSGLSIID
jgi:hypothetical protein